MGDGGKHQQLPSVAVGGLGAGAARRRGIKTAFQQKSAQLDAPDAQLAAYVSPDGRYRGVCSSS